MLADIWELCDVAQTYFSKNVYDCLPAYHSAPNMLKLSDDRMWPVTWRL
jgi:hypothetical protein